MSARSSTIRILAERDIIHGVYQVQCLDYLFVLQSIPFMLESLPIPNAMKARRAFWRVTCQSDFEFHYYKSIQYRTWSIRLHSSSCVNSFYVLLLFHRRVRRMMWFVTQNYSFQQSSCVRERCSQEVNASDLLPNSIRIPSFET